LEPGGVQCIAGEIARVPDLGVHPPEDKEVRPIAELAQGAGGATAPLAGDDAGRDGVTRDAVEPCARAVGQRDCFALRLDGDVRGQIDQRGTVTAEQLGDARHRTGAVRRIPSQQHLAGHAPVAEPPHAKRAGVARFDDAVALDPERDIITGTAAAQADDVFQHARRRHATLRSGLAARAAA
jgi:hypothetical protein